MKFRTIIVDDEPAAREGLAVLVKNDPDLEIVAICRNATEAIAEINNQQPDLVLLDIQMPGMDGFAVIKETKALKTTHFIFITAHQQYALKAFEVHAVDYLLKPFSDDRFYEAINNAKDLIKNSKALDQNMPEKESKSEPIIIKSLAGWINLAVTEIVWLEAYDYYLKIHTKTKMHMARITLKKMLRDLPSNFIRIHKSYVINLDYLQKLSYEDGKLLVTLKENKIRLVVSRQYQKEIKERMKK